MTSSEIAKELAERMRGDFLTFAMMAANVRDPKLQADLIAEGKERRDLVARFDAQHPDGITARNSVKGGFDQPAWDSGVRVER